MNKYEAIAKFVEVGGKSCQFGNLICVRDSIFTYNELLALVDRENRVVYLNSKKFSKTSTRHFNLVYQAVCSTYLTPPWEINVADEDWISVEFSRQGL